MYKYIGLLLLFFAVHFSLSAQQERILEYHTDIVINKDRSVTITEEIKAYVLGNQIKRGITRNLPKRRSFGDKEARVKYEILSVKKNGEKEPYHEREANGDVILYFGSEDVFLTPGTYFYELKYKVNNQIAFFENYDEIYWNAIGQSVQFTVDTASCRVYLPDGVGLVQQSAYTGKYGEQGKAFTFYQEGNVLQYATNRPLQAGEGFTVGVGFEKGYISPPGFFERFGTLLIIALGFLLLIPYYIYTWFKYGQDPPTPASYPIWESPDGLSSASISYIHKKRYQQKGFTASIIHLAIKGHLRIEEVESSNFLFKSKNFNLIKTKDADNDLPDEERQLLRSLFGSSDTVSINGEYDPAIESAYKSHRSDLNAQHKDFITEGSNYRLVIFPIIFTLIVGAIAIAILVSSTYAEGINMTAMFIAVPIWILCLFLYGYLIEKPTVDRIDLRSRIRGFLMYLEMAEADRLNILNPPEMTPEHFETALPYAFALGVEHKWSKKFESILAQAQYQPEWHNSSPMYFSNNFGRSFSQNVSGATTQPSSSGGGSGGGGFSGGGGGGGGVGGW